MSTPYKEGTYIVYWSFNNPLDSLYGRVIGSEIISDRAIKYTLKTRDGGIKTIIDDGHNNVTNPMDYVLHICCDARNYKKIAESATQLLEELLGEDIIDARDIAESYQRDRIYEIGEEVIVFPLFEGNYNIDKRQKAKVIDVDFSNRLGYDACNLPVYTVLREDGSSLKISGRDFSFSEYFIGTQDDLIHLLVSKFDEAVGEIEKTERIREDLLAELQGAELNNLDRSKMELPIEHPKPLPTRQKG